MNERLRLRYWEWGSFCALLAVICVVLTLLPLPRAGQSQVAPERLFFLPIVPPSLQTEVEEIQEESESSEEDSEEQLTAEEMEALLAEAFGEAEAASDPPMPMDLSSQSVEALTVEGLDLSSWDTGSGANRLGIDQERNLDLRGRASSTRRLSATLVQPDVAGGEAGRIRMQLVGSGDGLDSLRGNANASRLDAQAMARRPPVTMDDFSTAVDEDSLGLWVKANLSALDPGIRSLFGGGPSVITARHAAQINGKAYELNMMLAPANGEVRITLIDGEALYYFVNPWERRQASYFQMGRVSRDADGRIVTVESEDLSPQGEQAQFFYGLFLDWWRAQNK